jgi:hypothetical protein
VQERAKANGKQRPESVRKLLSASEIHERFSISDMRYPISDLLIRETLTALLSQAGWQYGQQSSPVSHLGVP